MVSSNKSKTQDHQLLDQKIHQISLFYKQLKKNEFYPVKKNLIGSMRKSSAQAIQILDKLQYSTDNIRKRKQIQDILKKCDQIEVKIDEQENKDPEIGNGGRFSNMEIAYGNTPEGRKLMMQNQNSGQNKNSLAYKSRIVARSIVFQEISSKQLKITPQELDELVKRMQGNNEVMKDIQMMIVEQGEDLDAVQKSIEQTYQMTKQANMDLEEASKLQHQGRIMKIRLGVTGFLGVLGMKIWGLPGLVIGMFGGIAATK